MKKVTKYIAINCKYDFDDYIDKISMYYFTGNTLKEAYEEIRKHLHDQVIATMDWSIGVVTFKVKDEE